MNYLEWNLDLEEGADLYDPVGNIKILGDEGIFEERYTYLDAFFEVFVEGAECMKIENVIKVDPLVEPNDILFSCKGSILKIEYGTQRAIIFNCYQFLEEVQKAVAKLGEILDEFADNSKQQKRKLIRLRGFLQKKA